MLHAGGDVSSAFDDLAEHMAGARNAVFLPYALQDHAAYTAVVRERFARLQVNLSGAHEHPNPVAAIRDADAIVVGGGNSFLLLRDLHRLQLIQAVRGRAAAGVPYFGASAGTNVACPTIRTTNDMPIVETPTLNAMHLIPLQINPHYVDPPEVRVGETRAERLQEFLQHNDVPVIGLREQSWLLVRGESMQLRGTAAAVLFRRGAEPEILSPPADLSHVLTIEPRFDDAL